MTIQESFEGGNTKNIASSMIQVPVKLFMSRFSIKMLPLFCINVMVFRIRCWDIQYVVR